MREDANEVKSIRTLQRLLAPVVARYVARRRRAMTTVAHAGVLHLPSAASLQSLTLFSRWPAAALQTWLASGMLECFSSGTTIAFPREPPHSIEVFWLLSGKVAQIPTKAELHACASDLVHLSHNTPITGPAVLPSLFATDTSVAAAQSPPPPPTEAQERLLDSLAVFHSGELVDADRLVLGGERLRGLRCQSDTAVLRLSLARLFCVLERLPMATRSATYTAARTSAQEAMARVADVPTVHAITATNPVLAALPLTTLKAMRLQLRPFVFLSSELICKDVFTSETVFFLQSGQVRVEDDNTGAHKRMVAARCTAFGLCLFVQCHMPDCFDQKLRATAVSYCEMWGITVASLLALSDATARLQCACSATALLLRRLQQQQLQQRRRGIVGSSASYMGRLLLAPALRSYPCFAMLSETAIDAIARALQLRVYPPGEVIVPAGRAPSCGIIVVAGNVHIRQATATVRGGGQLTRLTATQSKTAQQQQLPPGQPRLFHEAFMRMGIDETVVAQSSAVVLNGSPALLFEALAEDSSLADDTRTMLRVAQEHVDHVYGVGACELSRAQYAAAARVHEYKRQHGEAETATVTAAETAPVSLPHRSPPDSIVPALENELFTSVHMQLLALHPDPDAAARFALFRGGGQLLPAAKASAVASNGDAKPPPQRRSGCFSLDAHGHLVTCADDVNAVLDAVDTEHTTAKPAASVVPPTRVQPTHAATVPVLPPLTPQPSCTTVTAAATTATGSHHAPSTPSLPSLRTAVTARVQAGSGQAHNNVRAAASARRNVSTRVAALRAAGRIMKDEVDGVDRRAVRQQQHIFRSGRR